MSSNQDILNGTEERERYCVLRNAGNVGLVLLQFKVMPVRFLTSNVVLLER